MTTTCSIIHGFAPIFRPYFGLCLTTNSAEKAYWVTVKKSLKVTMEEAPIQALTRQLHKIYPIISNKKYQNVFVGSQFNHNDFKMGAPLPFFKYRSSCEGFLGPYLHAPSLYSSHCCTCSLLWVIVISNHSQTFT